MKRLSVALLTLVLAAGFLAGCCCDDPCAPDDPCAAPADSGGGGSCGGGKG